jgi:hypothetical protein
VRGHTQPARIFACSPKRLTLKFSSSGKSNLPAKYIMCLRVAFAFWRLSQ